MTINRKDGDRASHDEPFVVDNGPAKLYLGKRNSAKKKDEKSGKVWLRHAGVFKTLVVHRLDDQGDLIDQVAAVDLLATGTTKLEVRMKGTAGEIVISPLLTLRHEVLGGDVQVVIDSELELELVGKTLFCGSTVKLALDTVKGYKNTTVTFDTMSIGTDITDMRTLLILGFKK